MVRERKQRPLLGYQERHQIVVYNLLSAGKSQDPENLRNIAHFVSESVNGAVDDRFEIQLQLRIFFGALVRFALLLRGWQPDRIHAQ